MTSFGRWRLPVVVPTVFEADRRFHQLLGRGVVEACDVDRVEVAELVQMASAKRLDAAAAAEVVADGVAAELVSRQSVLSLQQPERPGFDDRFPEPRLGADRAVALARTLGQVDVGFETDRAAVTASCICPLHYFLACFHSAIIRPSGSVKSES